MKNWTCPYNKLAYTSQRARRKCIISLLDPDMHLSSPLYPCVVVRCMEMSIVLLKLENVVDAMLDIGWLCAFINTVHHFSGYLLWKFGSEENHTYNYWNMLGFILFGGPHHTYKCYLLVLLYLWDRYLSLWWYELTKWYIRSPHIVSIRCGWLWTVGALLVNYLNNFTSQLALHDFERQISRHPVCQFAYISYQWHHWVIIANIFFCK